MGVTWFDLKEKSPEEILYQIADAMKETKTPTDPRSFLVTIFSPIYSRLSSLSMSVGFAVVVAPIAANDMSLRALLTM